MNLSVRRFAKYYSEFTHPLYKQATGDSYDAVAWAFLTKDKIDKIKFNFYPIRNNEVRANVLYCGLCHSDILMSRSQWFKNLTYPIVSGHEIVAEVNEVGKDVKNLKKGDKVGFGFIRDCCGKCEYCLKGKENLCIKTDIYRPVFGHYFGGFATQIQQPEKFFYKLPEGIKLDKTGPLLCAGITVYAPMKNWLKKGDKTAVVGVGGLGHMAVQFLSKLGHEVTAFNNHLDYQDLIKQLGAKEVVNSTNKDLLKKYAGKFNFIINTVPFGNISDFISLCAPQARFIQIGLPDEKEPLTVPHILLVFGEIQLIGSIVGTIEDNKDMLSFASKNNIYPICEEYAFDNYIQAVEKIEKGKPKFRIVINVQDYAKKNNLWKH